MKFIVADMTCDHCKATVEKAVAEAGGQASVDLPGQSVTIRGITPDQAVAAIRDAGYTPVATQ